MSSGKVVVAENAHARRPFDTIGDIALESAAQRLANRPLQGITGFSQRATLDYRLAVLNLSHPQSLAFQDAFR